MRFTSAHSLSLIGVLAIALSTPVEAASSACQMCGNDVVKSIPQCKGVESLKQNPKSFSDFSSNEQACLCAIAHDVSPFMKCDPLCPPGNIALNAENAKAFAAVYCKPDGGGPLGSTSSSASSMPCSHLASAAAAIVLSAVALS